MLSQYIIPNELFAAQKDYISKSAQMAADIYGKMGVKYEIFEGTTIDLNPSLAEQTYKDLLSKMIEKNTLVGHEYGLFATIIPLKELGSGRVMFGLQLGVLFPHFKDDKKTDKKT